MTSKNWDFCNFYDYYYEKELRKIATNVKLTNVRFFTTHEKSQFFLLRANLDISETCGSALSTTATYVLLAQFLLN